MEKMLQVGVITSTHGLTGEVKVYPTTDDPLRFKKLKEAILDTPKGQITVHPEHVKFFKNMVILKFKEYSTIEEVQALHQVPILVTREHAVPLAEGEHFIADLIGCRVYDDSDKLLGELVDVLQTAANDVYVVKMESGKELLIPVIKDCILKVDEEHEYIQVHLLEGLMDL